MPTINGSTRNISNFKVSEAQVPKESKQGGQSRATAETPTEPLYLSAARSNAPLHPVKTLPQRTAQSQQKLGSDTGNAQKVVNAGNKVSEVNERLNLVVPEKVVAAALAALVKAGAPKPEEILSAIGVSAETVREVASAAFTPLGGTGGFVGVGYHVAMAVSAELAIETTKTLAGAVEDTRISDLAARVLERARDQHIMKAAVGGATSAVDLATGGAVPGALSFIAGKAADAVFEATHVEGEQAQHELAQLANHLRENRDLRTAAVGTMEYKERNALLKVISKYSAEQKKHESDMKNGMVVPFRPELEHSEDRQVLVDQRALDKVGERSRQAWGQPAKSLGVLDRFQEGVSIMAHIKKTQGTEGLNTWQWIQANIGAPMSRSTKAGQTDVGLKVEDCDDQSGGGATAQEPEVRVHLPAGEGDFDGKPASDSLGHRMMNSLRGIFSNSDNAVRQLKKGEAGPETTP